MVAITATAVMPLATGANSCDNPPPDKHPVTVACTLSGAKSMTRSTTYVVANSFHTNAVRPGTYKSCGGRACSWYKTKKNPSAISKSDKILSQGGGNYRQIITLTSQDKAFTTSGCSPWYKR